SKRDWSSDVCSSDLTRRMLDVRPDDTMVNWLPVDHSGAFLLYHMLAVFVGCTNVHTPTEPVLADPLRWLDLLDEHGAQHSWAPKIGRASCRERVQIV